MSSVALTARILGRLGDLLGLLAVLPLLTNVKFGALIRAQDEAARLRRKAEEAKKTEEVGKAAGKAAAKQGAKGPAAAAAGEGPQPDEEESPHEACIPPAWAILLLLLAELCACAHLFDPSDKLVQRGVGEVIRVQRRVAPGFQGTIAAFEKLIADKDVYELLRFGAACAGLTSLLGTAALGLHEPSAEAAEGHPLRVARRAALKLLQALASPRLWFLAALVVAFSVKNWSLLSKVARRQGAAELAKAAAPLLRALAVGGAVLGTKHGGPMPFWAALAAAGALARGARSFVYERVPLATLLDPQAGGAAAAAARAALALEALAAVMALPCACRRRRLALGLALLLAAGAVLLADGQAARLVEPYVEPADRQLSVSVAGMAVAVVFLGGFPTMMTSLALMQVMNMIHKLDAVRF